jgi:hypothetical protein
MKTLCGELRRQSRVAATATVGIPTLLLYRVALPALAFAPTPHSAHATYTTTHTSTCRQRTHTHARTHTHTHTHTHAHTHTHTHTPFRSAMRRVRREVVCAGARGERRV